MQIYFLIASCFKDQNDFSDAIYAYAIDLHKLNIFHIEVHCTPWIHLSRGVEIDDIAIGLYNGIEKALKELPISINIIFDLIRMPEENAEKIIDWMIDLPRSHFIALGFSGGPKSIPYKHYAKFCNKVRKYGYKIVAHAGELEGADSIRSAINYLSVDRISHGTRVFDDPNLVNEVIEKNIHLEFCPTSNSCLGVKGFSLNLIKLFRKLGGNCSINTDDELLFNTNLNNEFFLLIDSLGFQDEDILYFINNSIRSSFMRKNAISVFQSKLNETLLTHNKNNKK